VGIIRTEFEFSSPANPNVVSLCANALIDTGAAHLCFPEHLAIQLNLEELKHREVTLANGLRLKVPYCGLVQIRFKSRRCFTCAIVRSDVPLIGAIRMEDMDLVVLSASQGVDVNPVSPNFPMSLAKLNRN